MKYEYGEIKTDETCHWPKCRRRTSSGEVFIKSGGKWHSTGKHWQQYFKPTRKFNVKSVLLSMALLVVLITLIIFMVT